jgi:hypothetical protein
MSFAIYFNKLTANIMLLTAASLPTVCQPISDAGATPEREAHNTLCKTVFTRLSTGVAVWSPNGKQYIINQQDAAGVFQVYLGTATSAPVCISCTQRANGPAPSKNKLQAHWHPSGEWIVLAVEMETYSPPPFSTPQDILGWLESGLWVNIWAMRPDGSQWYQLSNFGQQEPANGFTGVAFTPDGTQGVWAQILTKGDIFMYLLGQWQLIQADFQVDAQGVPSFTNQRNITPAGANWIEPGDIAPDGRSLLITADIGMSNPAGMDQYILDLVTGDVVNLTKSPTIWDEHGVWSPDGKKILFMSSYPFRNDPNSDNLLFLKTEFMLMDRDGSNLVQLSHFNTPGYPESNAPNQGSVAAVGAFTPDGRKIFALNLFFPNYQTWSIAFQGRCSVRPPEAFHLK